jgi:hypothetical protein
VYEKNTAGSERVTHFQQELEEWYISMESSSIPSTSLPATVMYS